MNKEEEDSIAIDKLLLAGKKIPAIKLYIDTVGGHVGEVKVIIEYRQEFLCDAGLAAMVDGKRYCEATEKGKAWLTEHEESVELNSKRHFYLYAKGHYKRSNDLLDDLKHIAAAYCGMAVEQYNDSDLIILLGKEAFKHIKNENIFVDMLKELHPDSSRSRMFTDGEPYMMRLMSQFLKFFAVAKIRDDNRVIINLGEADPEILPLSESEKNYRMEEQNDTQC